MLKLPPQTALRLRSHRRVLLAVLTGLSLLVHFIITFQPRFPDVLLTLQETRGLDDYTIISDPATGLSLIDYDRQHLKYIPPEMIATIQSHVELRDVYWDKFAYVVYVSKQADMCNAMVVLQQLREGGTRAQLLMLVEEWIFERLPLSQIQEYKSERGVNVKKVSFIGTGTPMARLVTLAESQYDRIVLLNTQVLLLKGNLDELFFLPPASVAAPTKYWETQGSLANPELKKDYDTSPLTMTLSERKRNLTAWIRETVDIFFPSSRCKLPSCDNWLYDDSKHYPGVEKVNEKNFYTHLYNQLPDIPHSDLITLNTQLLVIQPSMPLFERVIEIYSEKPELYTTESSLLTEALTRNSTLISSFFYAHLIDIPDLLILPHQLYGTSTFQLNMAEKHDFWSMDVPDQPHFAPHSAPPSTQEAGTGSATTHRNKLDPNTPYYHLIDSADSPYTEMYASVRVLHIDDDPIPGPGTFHDPTQEYMKNRRRCPSFPDFGVHGIVHPDFSTDDCTSGVLWENAYRVFGEKRRVVCDEKLRGADVYANYADL